VSGLAVALAVAAIPACGDASGPGAAGPVSSSPSTDGGQPRADAGPLAVDASDAPPVVDAAPSPEAEADADAQDCNASLRQAAVCVGSFYGCAANTTSLGVDAVFTARFARECGMLVPEYELKWDTVRPTPTTFNFVPGDELLAFAQQNGMLFRGHTLVWYESLPSWVFTTINASNAQQYLTDHITTVVGHYAGKVHSWDVVNEAINPSDGEPGGLRNSPWYQWLGSGYIETAFRTAAAADPKAILVYNDYGVETSDAAAATKRADVLALLRKLVTEEIPIHALGIQSHMWGDGTNFDPVVFKTFLDQVAALGLRVLATEMDVRDNAFPADTTTRDQDVGAYYARYAGALLSHPATLGLLTWGVSDKYTWLDSDAPRPDGLPQRPLPVDDQMATTKPAYAALLAAFGGK
jgi:endo-1,4-beta-xylanase